MLWLGGQRDAWRGCREIHLAIYTPPARFGLVDVEYQKGGKADRRRENDPGGYGGGGRSPPNGAWEAAIAGKIQANLPMI